ncbi:MAG: NAD-glutamate dehydrogenase [Devosia nanyangense]|uniref:NAD-glutamate dehydrogenase n=1 Tax=Devosia nanyangense TaxID=1228055 RepID=A0A933L294_9HYPH|nr:NAD-glutamate dehydrogenase [Devosia nanyangense]
MIDTGRGLAERAEALRETEPNFARFLMAAANATAPDDLSNYSPEVLEAMLRKTYTRLGKREDKSHRIYDLDPEHPGHPQMLEMFSTDMPFIVDSVLAAIRAKGGVIRFMAHPVLHLDPESHRLLDDAAPVSVNESLLIVHIEPIADPDKRAALIAEIDGTLTEVYRATRSWRTMLERLRRVVEDWKLNPPRATSAAISESKEFLGWLAEHNFTFLGMREYKLDGEGAEQKLVPLVTTGLGLLEDKDFLFLRSGGSYVETTAQHDVFFSEPDPLMVTKANVRTRVHRRAHLDYIGVKLYHEGGRVSGELRIIGLFTSMALATPHSEVPLIRRKVSEVMRRSGYDAASHAGKSLMAALDTYPRDELFQIGQDQLFEFAREIAALADRPRVRVLPRLDRFDNFVSVLVFVPRDRYTSEARARIGDYLARSYDGRISAYYPHFPEGELVRVHFIIGRNGGRTPRPSRDDLEDAVGDLILTFGDRLAAAADETARMSGWLEAFSPAYQSRNSAADALADIAVIEKLEGDTSLALKLVERKGGDGAYGLKVYHRGRPIPLSDRVPMLENFGFRVIDEHTYTVEPEGDAACFIHDMVLDTAGGAAEHFAERAPLIEEAILAVWQTEAESDGLNQLTLRAGLGWSDVAIIRALLRYLKQVGVTYSRAYLAQVLNHHAGVARSLLELFHAELDLGFAGNRERAITEAHEAIAKALEATQSLDEDRIIRRVLNLIDAAIRTNAYQRDGDGRRRPALAIKFDCSKVDGLPEPKPFREIFVYSPRVEGLHLRFGAIARGGLRWSDRPEDFRTEVLGLVKAQQVKNAIIVPVGAKGAFVPRQMPAGADRDTVLAEGTACYKIFVSTLLDVTDNLEGDVVLPPPDVRRRDGDDPYLVVAADKGTASFSDTANSIALERGYWLGDAFASGGSNGYDHKKMGITARGAWEAVKRHFRELDRDIQTAAFTVAGVGDMSGDVFGNGMLLSPQIRLIAAFDHRDIFIDPDPDPVLGLAERRRLFELPRSSWQDYDKTLLSKGGGVYSRSLKNVALFQEARKALGLGNDPVTPQEVIVAILKAEVDLLWFGGIGTYVRGSNETDAEAGDKANDAIRIAGRDIRARVVGEGANLAVTQKGRIDYALAGGHIDTDAIDNSAGVNASDIEVNVKIALTSVVRSGQLDADGRNAFLAEMTGEVAALCLRNNYLQPLALSLAERAGVSALPDHRALIESLEQRGLLSRAVEALPDDATLNARAAAGKALTRPELATILAYAKNALYADLLVTKAPDDPYLGHELFRYFPPTLADRYPDAVIGHRLRREVIATVLSNQMINRGGPAYVVKMMAATSADAGMVAAAYCLARDAYGLERLYAEIDALDGEISGTTQLALYAELGALLEHETLWLLRNADFAQPLGDLVLRYAEGVTDVTGLLASLLPPSVEKTIATHAEGFAAGGAPAGIARRISELGALSFATDIAQVAERTKSPVAAAAGAFFGVLDLFGLASVIASGNRIVLADRFERMALDRALANLLRAQRDLTVDVLGFGRGEIGTRLAAWRQARPDAIDRVAASVESLTKGEMTVSRLSVAAGLLADLARSA